MNKIIAALGFLIFAGYTIPGVSWAHTHLLRPPDLAERSAISVDRGELIGPLPMREGLSQSMENPVWNSVNLTHTDPQYSFGSNPYHPAFSRHSSAPDGAAVMFGWTFDRPW